MILICRFLSSLSFSTTSYALNVVLGKRFMAWGSTLWRRNPRLSCFKWNNSTRCSKISKAQPWRNGTRFLHKTCVFLCPYLNRDVHLLMNWTKTFYFHIQLKMVFSSFKDVKVIQFSSMQDAFLGFMDKVYFPLPLAVFCWHLFFKFHVKIMHWIF